MAKPTAMPANIRVNESYYDYALRMCEENAELQSQLDEAKAQYHELLMAVQEKHEGETRHETALRYIVERENKASSIAYENAEFARLRQQTKGAE